MPLVDVGYPGAGWTGDGRAPVPGRTHPVVATDPSLTGRADSTRSNDAGSLTPADLSESGMWVDMSVSAQLKINIDGALDDGSSARRPSAPEAASA